MENIHIFKLEKPKIVREKVIELFRYKLNEFEFMVLEKETNEYLNENTCYCTHLDTFGGKIWGHFNMDIVSALKDLANRIKNHN